MKSKTALRIWTASFPLSIVLCAILFLFLNSAKGQSVYIRDLIDNETLQGGNYWIEHDPTSEFVIIVERDEFSPFYLREFDKDGVPLTTFNLCEAKLYPDCNECQSEFENDIQRLRPYYWNPQVRLVWMELY